MSRAGLPLVLAALALALAPPSALAGPRAFLGISTVNASPAPAMPAGESRTFPSALEIVFVAPGGPGEAAGLREGDVVLALDGQGFDPKDGDPAVAWRRRIESMTPGASATLTVLRRSVVTRALRDGAEVADPDALIAEMGAAVAGLPAGAALTVEARRVERVEEVPLTLAPHPLDAAEGFPPPAAPALPDADAPTGYAAIAAGLAARAGKVAPLQALRAGLRTIALSRDPVRLQVVRHALRWPWSLPQQARDASAEKTLPVSGARGQRSAAAWAEWMLHDRWPEHPARALPSPGAGGPSLPRTAEDVLDDVAAALQRAATLREAALRELSSEERAFVVERAAGLPAALAETIYLHADEDAARAKANRRLLELARRADASLLLRAAQELERLADPAWLAEAGRLLRALPNAGDEIVLRRPSPQGEIVVGGAGRNTYRDAEPAAIVDLGGDDLYANGAGTAMGDARPVALVLDLAGDDRYEGTDAFVQGCGVLGVGLLVDVAGDDRYLAKDGAQGCGLVGGGMVIDRAGSDRYRALHFAQGVGFFGFGALLDGAGDDSYEALSQAQGLGLPGGVGLLHDAAGDDRYFAKGGAKTGYGTQGVYDGWSQGCGLGLRYLASGGFGLLADDAGADEYEAGNFSQGGGYFFGFGMLRDGGSSDDRYLGSRYGQGWSAHQAVGAFLEEGGDDRYETTHGVIAGLAWDQSVTWFCDRAGDDAYRGSFFSLGASAHDAVAIFEDDDGADTYAGVEIARSGPNDYHGGTSFSLFLDLGRGRDVYEKGAPGRLQANGEHGFALDLPGRLEDWGGADAGALGAWLDASQPSRRRLGR